MVVEAGFMGLGVQRVSSGSLLHLFDRRSSILRLIVLLLVARADQSFGQHLPGPLHLMANPGAENSSITGSLSNPFIASTRISLMKAAAPFRGSPSALITAVSPGDFSIVLFPDTQNEAQFHPEVLASETQWVVNNAAA